MKQKYIPALVVLASVATSLALGQEEMPMGEFEQDMPRYGMMDRLNLSDDQRNQIEKLRTDFQKQQIPQRGKVETAQIELRELLRAENPDKAAIEKKINELAQLRAQLSVARVNQMFAVRNVLTPEQQKMIRDGMRERFREGFGGPRHPMGGFRGQQFGRRFDGPMNRFGPEFRHRRFH
ncbi:MAG: Spy/CpxP family protein refolding chaperone [Bacteroidota bacterium]